MQQKLAASNKALDHQIKVINNSFAETLRSTGQYSTHFLTLTSDVEKFGRNLDAGRLKLRDYFRVYQDHQKTSTGLIRDLAKQQTQLQNAILQPLGRNAQGLMQFNVHVPRGLDLIKNKTGLARLELQIMNKVIQDGAVQLINWGKNTQWAGRQLTVGLTVPLAMFGKAAADAFKQADQELTRLTKVYGDVAGTSAEELGKIRNEVAATAKELSASMGVGFTETIALAADIAATGKQGNDLLGALTETTRLAVLGEVDRAEAMQATLSIQTAFKQNTDELSDSINFLNAVENQTSTSLQDLVIAIPKAGPVIKQLGGSVQELALYLTAMREGGINASESANALKSGLASLINPTKQTVGVMSEFGIDILGMVNKNAGNTTSLLFDLQAALDNLDPLQKAQAIEQLFGKFQFARISALLNNLGRQGSQTLQVLDLMGESASNLEAVAGRELAAVTESAAGRYRRAIEGLKADLAGVGEQFLNISTNLINFVNGIVDFANKLPKPVKQALALVGGITAIAGPLIMLTGVLANFFGYIVKGLAHMRALFKGGEGFRLLTPEILAAERAGSLIEKTFYDDAQAASVLNTALKNLIDSFTVLQSKAAAGQFSVNPAVSTMAGSSIVASSAAGRIVDPNNPFLGPMGTRASAHMNPRDPNNPASLFGLVPSTGPVNLKVGKNPMYYAGGDLPGIQGLTSYGGVSAGIYAPEAARWHALMATMGMQTRQEMEDLKNIIATGGTVSRDIMTTFDDILPLMSNITDGAAKQTQLIVAEMQAGKITIAEARTRIMQLNAQVEAELIATAQTFAASRGRSIDVTRVPGLDQPVVGLTGSSNMRELFHKERSRRMMEALGRATRTRTFGGGYNIATTVPGGLIIPGAATPNPTGLILPPGYNTGGNVFYNNGDQVPGPNINADVVPAMLTPGEFVIRRDVAQQDPGGMRALNEGRAIVVPTFNKGGVIPGIQYRNAGNAIRSMVPVQAILRMFPGRFRPGLNKPQYEPKGTAGVFGGNVVNSAVARRLGISGNRVTRERINARMRGEGVPPDVLLLSMLSGSGSRRTSTDEFLNAMVRAGLMSPADASTVSNRIFEQYARRIANMDLVNDLNNPIWSVSDIALASQSPLVREAWRKFSSTPGMLAGPSRGSLSFLDSFTLSNGTVVNFNKLKGSRTETFYHAGRPDPLAQILSANGYNLGGGVVRKGRKYYGARALPVNHRFYANLIKQNKGIFDQSVVSKSFLLQRLGARYRFDEKSKGYVVTSLPTNPNLRIFSDLGLSPAGERILYGNLIDRILNSRSQGMDASRKRGFSVEKDAPDMWQHALLRAKNSKSLSPQDQAIIDALYDKASRTMNNTMPKALEEQLFDSTSHFSQMQSLFRNPKTQYKMGGKIKRYNRGGRVGYYNRGGMIPRYNRGGGIPELKFAGPELLASARAAGLIPPQPRRQISPMMGNVISMGTGMAGGALGSQFGMMGNMVGFFAGQAAGTALMNRLMGDSVQKTSLLSRAFTSLSALPGPVKVLGAVAGIALAIKTVNDRINEHRRIVDQGFAPTEDTVKKLNLQFEKTSEVLNKAQENMRAMRETGQALYRSNTNLGIPGVSLTIEQFDELSNRIKNDFPDLVEVFNKAQPGEVLAKAEQMKAQFVAGGMSAQEATDFIYTLIKASNDANMALTAISNKGFKGISDSSSAAASSVKTFETLVNDLNVDQIPEAFDTVRVSIDAMRKDLVGTKDATGKIITEADALQITMERLRETSDINLKLSNSQLNAIKEQNPVLNNILSSSEDLQSIYSKTELYVRGITTGLKELSAEAANAKLALTLMVETQLRSAEGPFKSLAKQISNLQKSSDVQKITREVQKTQDQIKKEIDLRQKNIEKIKEEADARLEALDRERNDEDALLQIRKLQLQYQNQIAAGQTEAAAQTAIDIQKAVGDQQTELARRAIEDKANARIRQEEDAIEKLQSELDRSQNRIDKANQAASDNAQKLAKFEDLMGRAVQATFMVEGGVNKFEREIINSLRKELSDAGFSDIAASLNTEERRIVRKGRGVIGAETAEVTRLFENQLQNAFDEASGALRVIVENPKDFFNTSGTGTNKNPISVSSSTYKNTVVDELNTTSEMKAVVEGENLKTGQIFTFRGKKFKVVMGAGSSVPYVSEIKPKFHNWNGVVPGPYNKEIDATLKAGTEGVYQQSYINSLRKSQTGNMIQVDTVVMKFPETPANGKQMFMEFKEAMRVENLKKGGTIRI
jgi:TP901 family phage tail tape measure protein